MDFTTQQYPAWSTPEPQRSSAPEDDCEDPEEEDRDLAQHFEQAGCANGWDREPQGVAPRVDTEDSRRQPYDPEAPIGKLVPCPMPSAPDPPLPPSKRKRDSGIGLLDEESETKLAAQAVAKGKENRTTTAVRPPSPTAFAASEIPGSSLPPKKRIALAKSAAHNTIPRLPT